uniref:Uncharacterized protein n=1 Tax=Kalanchoe fedtschenkoi TaxID=63787 RepID=A0A7N0UYT1_KALFE
MNWDHLNCLQHLMQAKIIKRLAQLRRTTRKQQPCRKYPAARMKLYATLPQSSPLPVLLLLLLYRPISEPKLCSWQHHLTTYKLPSKILNINRLSHPNPRLKPPSVVLVLCFNFLPHQWRPKHCYCTSERLLYMQPIFNLGWKSRALYLPAQFSLFF